MADNVTVDTITGTPVVASDDIAGVQYQRIKLIHGINGTNDGDVSTANPLPVGDAGGSLTVDDGGTSLTVDGTVEVTNAGLTALNGAISGTEVQVDVVTMPTVAVTGTFYQATQPVSIASAVPVTDNSGTLTVDDGGLSLTVDGTIAATQSGTWNVGTVTTVTGITNAVAVTDNAGSLTVDAPVATPVFVRLSDGSSAISTLPVSLASVPSHAVTNAGTFATQVTSISAGDNNIGNVDVVTLPAIPAGTNNIGDVDVLTLPALPAGTNNIGDVDVLTQPARSRTVDAISVAEQTDVLMNGLTALTPKFATISAAASGDNTLVAAVTSKKIRVLSLFMMSAGTVNAYIRDDAGTPVNLIGDATNKLTLVSSSGFVLPHNPLGWCETTSGEGLQLNLSAAIGVAGCLTYVEV